MTAPACEFCGAVEDWQPNDAMRRVVRADGIARIERICYRHPKELVERRWGRRIRRHELRQRLERQR